MKCSIAAILVAIFAPFALFHSAAAIETADESVQLQTLATSRYFPWDDPRVVPESLDYCRVERAVACFLHLYMDRLIKIQNYHPKDAWVAVKTLSRSWFRRSETYKNYICMHMGTLQAALQTSKYGPNYRPAGWSMKMCNVTDDRLFSQCYAYGQFSSKYTCASLYFKLVEFPDMEKASVFFAYALAKCVGSWMPLYPGW